MQEVESLPNLVKLVQAPRVDAVLRIEPLEARTLDLLNGPDAEEWAQIQRLVYLYAPVEAKGAQPVTVGNRTEWTLLPEDVPVVKLNVDLTTLPDNPDSLRWNKSTREHLRELSRNRAKEALKNIDQAPSAQAVVPVPKKRGRPRKVRQEV